MYSKILFTFFSQGTNNEGEKNQNIAKIAASLKKISKKEIIFQLKEKLNGFFKMKL